MVLEQIANLSVVNSAYGFKFHPLRFAMSPVGRGGGLENLLTVMVLGFESLSWRFRCIAVMVAERLAKSSCRNAVQVRFLYAPL